MALTYRISLLLAAFVAFLLVAVLPPRSCADLRLESSPPLVAQVMCPGGGYVYESYGSVHRNAMRAAWQKARRELAGRELADSARRAIARGAVAYSADHSVAAFYRGSVSADSARTWANLVAAERNLVPGTGSHARLVVNIDARGDDALRPGVPRVDLPRAFASISGADTMCLVTIHLNTGNSNLEPQRSRGPNGYHSMVLGFCGLVSRLGMPSPAYEPSFRSAFRADNSSRWYTYWNDDDYYNPRARLLRGRPEATSYLAVACMRDDLAACDRFVDLNGTRDRDYYYGGRARRGFIVDLLVSDPSRFERVWHGTGTLPDAITAAYGRPAGVLVRDYLRAQFVVPARDTVPGMAAGAGWLVAALALSFVIGTRRRTT